MKKNYHKSYYIPYNLANDPLSSFVRDFTFAPHSFGHQEQDVEAVCDYRVMGDFELIFIVGGESHITVGPTEYICGRGDVVLIPPFSVNRIQTPPTNPHHDYWVHFDLYPYYRHADFLTALLKGEGHRLKVDGQCFEEVLCLFRRIEEEVMAGKPGSKALVDLLVTQIITLLLRSSDAAGLSENQFADRNTAELTVVNKSLELIHDRVNVPLSVEEICEALHISQSYLFKSFSRIMKMPPNNYIQLYKIKRAEQLMKTTEMTFREISEQLGFASPYYFSSVFKKYYQLSPRDYRKQFAEHRI